MKRIRGKVEDLAPPAASLMRVGLGLLPPSHLSLRERAPREGTHPRYETGKREKWEDEDATGAPATLVHPLSGFCPPQLVKEAEDDAPKCQGYLFTF